MKILRLQTLVAALVIGGGLAASAGTNGFVVPTIRGLSSTTFSGWESFTVGIGEPGNSGSLAGSDPSARLFQTAPGALVLGSGNIYNGEGKSLFDVRYTAPSDSVGQVSLQVRTLGTELDYSSVKLIAAGDAGAQTLTASRVELDRLAFGPPPPNPGSGVGVSSLWQWDLSGLGAEYFVIQFGAADINLSLDSATLDVQLVPEPGAGALLALGALIVFVSRRARAGSRA